MTDYYKVMYNGINLYKYEMNDNEKSEIEDFRSELINICNDLEIPRGTCFDGSTYMGRLKDSYEFKLKYKEDVGYFILDGERGKYNLRKGFPTIDRTSAKLLILNSEFFYGGTKYEAERRDELSQEWVKKYQVDYDSRKKAFEYTIRMLITVFEDIPDRTIINYTNYMNKWFEEPHWYFDKGELEFKEIIR